MAARFATNGGNVGSMKKLARQDFIPGLARRCKAGERPVIKLRADGISQADFERQARNYGLGWNKKDGQYTMAYIG